MYKKGNSMIAWFLIVIVILFSLKSLKTAAKYGYWRLILSFTFFAKFFVTKNKSQIDQTYVMIAKWLDLDFKGVRMSKSVYVFLYHAI